MCWNISGWGGPNQSSKIETMLGLSADVYFLSETWTRGNETIRINGYHTFINNRQLINRRCGRGSGGTAMLVKNSLFNTYFVRRTDHGEEGIISINLINKTTEFTTTIVGAYIPPEGSVYCQNIESFYENMNSLLYECYDTDLIMVGGTLTVA